MTQPTARPLPDRLRDTVTDPAEDVVDQALRVSPETPLYEIEGVSPMKCPSPEIFRLRRASQVVTDDVVGVSPMVAPTMPIAELRRLYSGE